jgi:hypothetical protein
VRNVVYRIHEKNSLKIRKARYGDHTSTPPSTASKLAASAAAASIMLGIVHRMDAHASAPIVQKQMASQSPLKAESRAAARKQQPATPPVKSKQKKKDLTPPQS